MHSIPSGIITSLPEHRLDAVIVGRRLTIGPADLAQDLGVFGTPDQARVLDEKRDLVLSAAKKHGKTCAMLCSSYEQAQQWKAAGALLLAYSSDSEVLHNAMSAAMARIKG